jgi:hypothetical protein
VEQITGPEAFMAAKIDHDLLRYVTVQITYLCFGQACCLNLQGALNTTWYHNPGYNNLNINFLHTNQSTSVLNKAAFSYEKSVFTHQNARCYNLYE